MEAEKLILLLLSLLPQVLWSNVTSGGVCCSVDMGDLNGDGIGEVVLAALTASRFCPMTLARAVTSQDSSQLRVQSWQ